ncbi:hypothetical protein N7522_008954 [Penicillium canescens]|nr:hypothetical protein N7522_008954 [Penicillium canescens]
MDNFFSKRSGKPTQLMKKDSRRSMVVTVCSRSEQLANASTRCWKTSIVQDCGESKRHGLSWSWAGVNSAVRLEWPNRLDGCTHPATILNVEMHGKLHDDFGYVEGGELVLEAPYRHIQLRAGSYSRNLLGPPSLAQRVLTWFGPLAKRRKLAQAILMRPDSPSRPYISRIIVPSSSKHFALIQVAKAGETLYLLILEPQRLDGARREER